MSGSDDEEYRPHARQVEIPSHNTDFAGPLGREMLERYSRKKKAKYNGGFLNRTPTLNELRDTGKWDVYAKTGPDPKDHEWINLEATYSSQGRGRPIRQIQMGHKLSAAEWFQRGSKKHIEKRHTEIFNSGPTKGRNLDQIEEKRKVVANSFSELKTPGKELKNLGERKVINSAFNMRFEHYSFNSKHGGDGFSYINKKTK